MLRHLFFMLKKDLKQVFVRGLLHIKRIILQPLITQNMENRKIRQKRFCMFDCETLDMA